MNIYSKQKVTRDWSIGRVLNGDQSYNMRKNEFDGQIAGVIWHWLFLPPAYCGKCFRWPEIEAKQATCECINLLILYQIFFFGFRRFAKVWCCCTKERLSTRRNFCLCFSKCWNLRTNIFALCCQRRLSPWSKPSTPNTRTRKPTQFVPLLEICDDESVEMSVRWWEISFLQRIQNLFLDVVKQGHSVVSVVALVSPE